MRVIFGIAIFYIMIKIREAIISNRCPKGGKHNYKSMKIDMYVPTGKYVNGQSIDQKQYYYQYTCTKCNDSYNGEVYNLYS